MGFQYYPAEFYLKIKKARAKDKILATLFKKIETEYNIIEKEITQDKKDGYDEYSTWYNYLFSMIYEINVSKNNVSKKNVSKKYIIQVVKSNSMLRGHIAW
jgi:hypothetical protein